MSNTNAILKVIDAGPEYEMPRGVANRLVAAGWSMPGGQARIETVLNEVANDADGDEDEVNYVAATALAYAGLRRA